MIHSKALALQKKNVNNKGDQDHYTGLKCHIRQEKTQTVIEHLQNEKEKEKIRAEIGNI